MAKFYGNIGYGTSAETPVGSGIHIDTIVEYPYYGNVVRNSVGLDVAESVNTNIQVNNALSIMADEFAYQHIHAIRYVLWAGSRWTVKSVTVKRPRLELALGVLYNGPTP